MTVMSSDLSSLSHHLFHALPTSSRHAFSGSSAYFCTMPPTSSSGTKSNTPSLPNTNIALEVGMEKLAHSGSALTPSFFATASP
eukprot:CAMPEP_0196244514 /NCGR_PEP_ID=MMETSP0913-20130531/30848_1 /TAXON_ID=49265 /ORGANISM="Thalassiosira rotula, Strain GSO102" /LENGTH=83 /DNA_ID=CAMNT_0041528479 /DNA_START=113 /DNA_END=360 /DNA_ORIENTATION=-